MFYYAEIDNEYLVVNTHSLTESSTNENYITITEEQYVSGELIGKYYNSFYGRFEIIDMMNYMGNSDFVTHYDTQMPLSTKIDNMQVEIHAKADANHTHDGYVSSDDLELLEDIINTKAEATHTHAGYAPTNHIHDEYATAISLDALADEIDGKAGMNHTHTEYAPITHSHDDYSLISHVHNNYAEVTHEHDDYALAIHSHTTSEIGAATSTHNHDSDYADINHDHNGVYTVVGHDHNGDYASANHVHDDYATVTSVDEISAVVANKANTSHSHNDTYYTEAEIDTKLSGKANISHSHNDVYYTEVEVNTLLSSKADTSHVHTGVYDAIGSAADALISAQQYTDSKIDALVGDGASTTLDTIGEISVAITDNQDAIDLLNSAIANKANVVDLNSHASDTELHITEAERIAWNAKSDFSGNYNDLTNKPSIPSISGLATEAYVNEAVSTKADSGHTHGDIYYTETEVNSLLSGKANSSHVHSIANVTGLQSTLDGKASSEHTHSVATSSVAGLMSASDKAKLNGIASGANAYTHPSYTARTGVPTANATLSHGGTFTVTQPVCDATGHITALNTRTYTLPSDNNTDTKVTNTLATTTKAYVTGTTSATTNTGTQVFDTGVYLDTTAGKLVATTFGGSTFSGSGVATVSETKTYLGI